MNLWQKLFGWLKPAPKAPSKRVAPKQVVSDDDLTWLDSTIWVTRDGRKLVPSQMDTNHLHNTVCMLERNAKRYLDAFILRYYVFGTRPHGDGAQDAFEREMEALMNADPVEWLKTRTIYKALHTELRKRWGLE
jgi:hypothetical protein